MSNAAYILAILLAFCVIVFCSGLVCCAAAAEAIGMIEDPFARLRQEAR